MIKSKQNKTTSYTQETEQIYKTLLSETTTLSKRIQLAEEIGKSREVALQTLTELVFYIRKHDYTTPMLSKSLKRLSYVTNAIALLHQNVQVKLVLEDLFFHFL